MTNAMIIFNEQLRLAEEGTIKTTGRMITIQDQEGNKKQVAEPEDIHTFAIWKKLGRQVKKGEKAKAQIVIWKYSPKTEEMEVTYENGTKGIEEVDASKMFMKKAFFFTIDQTESIAK